MNNTLSWLHYTKSSWLWETDQHTWNESECISKALSVPNTYAKWIQKAAFDAMAKFVDAQK